MKHLLIFIGIFIGFNSCQNNHNKLSVFVGFTPICKNYKIIMYINDSLIYKEDIPGIKLGGRYIPALQINKTDSIMKFKVQINEYDTTFIYNVTNVDSMLVGLYFDPSNIDHQRASDLFYKKIESDSLKLGKHDGFFIFTNNNPYVWLSE